MHARIPSQHPIDPQQPLDSFAQCHAGITRQLEALGALPELARAAQRARDVAAGTEALFRDAVVEHHAEEEKDLFPAVLRSAAPGEERALVASMVQRLTAEHRAVEALWERLRPGVRLAAQGRPVDLDVVLVRQLVRGYLQHAKFEEEHFLPLAATVLRRDGNHVAALALALHLRHVPQPVGYI
jgi:hemerythrin-like domain-containing protein